MAGFYRVRNFDRFQHYKDRNPPWIKLYYDLLADYRFACLQDASKSHLILMWLLATRTGNQIPDDPQWIARAIHATAPVDLKALVSSGFLEHYNELGEIISSASNMLASCKHLMRPETETETETEKAPKGALSASADGPGFNGQDSAMPSGSTPCGQDAPETAADAEQRRRPKPDEPTKPAKGKTAAKAKRTKGTVTRKGRPDESADDAKPEHGELRDYFLRAWKARYGADYAWRFGREDAHAKKILDLCGRNAAQAKRIVDSFMRDNDPWLAERGHELSLLVSRINRYRAMSTGGAGVNDDRFSPGFVPKRFSASELDALVGPLPALRDPQNPEPERRNGDVDG